MTEPPAVQWDGSLESLFAALDETCRRGIPPRRLDRAGPPVRAPSFAGPEAEGDRPVQPELFAAPETQAALGRGEDSGGASFPMPEGFPPVFPDLRHDGRCPGSPSAALLYELSADAFGVFVHAWMSELPIEAEIIRFAWKVISAARKEVLRGRPPCRSAPPAEPAGPPEAGAFGPAVIQNSRWAALPEARGGAEKAASGRGDPEVRVVLEAAYKAVREIDRLRGLLRFTPCLREGGSGGPVYVARCSPDHYILPGLAGHFTRRFGECPWAVIDEKRNIVLVRDPGTEARLFPLNSNPAPALRRPVTDGDNPPDCYEGFWRTYHHSINNPDRNNPALQRQFMPRRYWKYLPEVQ